MQDVGGCRTVLASVTEVQAVVQRYKQSSTRHELAGMDDYTVQPKDSGYRGVFNMSRENCVFSATGAFEKSKRPI